MQKNNQRLKQMAATPQRNFAASNGQAATMTVREAINSAMCDEIERDEKRKLKARKRRAARKRAKMMKKAMEEIDEHARERLT